MGESRRRRERSGPIAGDIVVRKEMFKKAYEQTCAAFDEPGSNIVSALLTTFRGRNYAIDFAVTQFAKHGPAECQAGCSSCCHQMVLCDPFEAISIAKYITDKMEEDSINLLTEAFRKMGALPMTVDARYGIDKPCPLLDAGRCSIYSIRPRVCRSLLSGSRAACESCLKGEENLVPYIMDGQVVAQAYNQGVQFALSSRIKLCVEQVELTRAVLLCLEDFDNTATTWLSGGDPFRECRPDRSNLPSDAAMAATAARACSI